MQMKQVAKNYAVPTNTINLQQCGAKFMQRANYNLAVILIFLSFNLIRH